MNLIGNHNGTVTVTLSERNLRDLLTQLGSGQPRAHLHRVNAKGALLVVVAEPDEVHYAGRES